jgi:hypothetical protein
MLFNDRKVTQFPSWRNTKFTLSYHKGHVVYLVALLYEHIIGSGPLYGEAYHHRKRNVLGAECVVRCCVR